jgi:hypothetical protein
MLFFGFTLHASLGSKLLFFVQLSLQFRIVHIPQIFELNSALRKWSRLECELRWLLIHLGGGNWRILRLSRKSFLFAETATFH